MYCLSVALPHSELFTRLSFVPLILHLIYKMCVNDFCCICDFRDKYGATPKDRLSEGEVNYQEIIDLLDSKTDPVLQEHIIKVSVYFQACSAIF